MSLALSAQAAISPAFGAPLRPNHATGLWWDPKSSPHDLAGHPESAARLTAILEVLQRRELMPLCRSLKPTGISEPLLLLGHKADYIEKVRSLSKSKQAGYIHHSKWASYYTPNTFEVAARASTGLADLCQKIARGSLRNGIALLRPPGHHATADAAKGFCVFNHVALSALNLLSTEPTIKKIAIVDLDAHHGNGIQDLVAKEPRILYVSTHQKDWFPYSGELRESGIHKQKTLLNLPLPRQSGDKVFAQIFSQVVLPKIRQFKPDFILVCAGYDCHWRDHMAELAVSLKGMARLHQDLISSAQNLCQGRIAFALEGGYNFQALSHGVANTVALLTGIPNFQDPLDLPPEYKEPDVSALITKARKIHDL